ncbi:helix-turn-helix domain-containing protein [Roseibium sp.]|uniref:helix-turn-helix domain-containing protein n=1 Tax=Roseibium sp. TaxID=1936156 RepID=UPI003D14D23F
MGLINHVGFTLEEEETLASRLILVGLGNSAVADKSAPKVRARSVATTLEYIEQHPADAVTISEICAATGVSWRTLDRAFMERFGIGPKTYLQRTRLSRVREQLAASQKGELRVSEIANN